MRVSFSWGLSNLSFPSVEQHCGRLLCPGQVAQRGAGPGAHDEGRAGGGAGQDVGEDQRAHRLNVIKSTILETYLLSVLTHLKEK